MIWPLLRGERLLLEGEGEEERPLPAREYRDWDRADTQVVSRPTFPTEGGTTIRAARAGVLEKHGRILEENKVRGRVFFRVFKEGHSEAQDLPGTSRLG